MKFLYLYVFLVFATVKGSAQTSYSEQLEASEKVIRESQDFSKQLHQDLVYSIFPYWYGTQWDFNGYTNEPNDGEIACGYFVSTTLKHIEFNMNRYDIAKMYSSDIVRVLCYEDYWVESNFETFLKRMAEQLDGIYVVGLSNHVGFLEQINGRTYIIHSNYIGDNGVEKELAYKSDALSYSSTFWVGNLSNNEKVRNAFLTNIEFKKIESE